jgi:hypothetical protein
VMRHVPLTANDDDILLVGHVDVGDGSRGGLGVEHGGNVYIRAAWLGGGRSYADSSLLQTSVIYYTRVYLEPHPVGALWTLGW